MLDAKTSPNLNRRDYLPMMGRALAFGTASCSSPEAESQGRLVSVTTKYTPTPLALLHLSPQSEHLNKFQYQPNTRTPLSSEIMRIGLSTIQILNYSNISCNYPTIEDYFTFLTQLPQKLSPIDINVSGRDLRFNLGLRPNVERRIYLVRPSDPIPTWWTNTQLSTNSLTLALPRSDGFEEAVSLVRFFESTAIKDGSKVPFTNIRQENEWAVIKALCQSTLVLTGQQPELNALAQEILFNTLGIAATMRSEGEDYRRFIELVRALPQERITRSIQLIDRFPQAQYQQIPSGKATR